MLIQHEKGGKEMNKLEKSVLCSFLVAVIAMTTTSYSVFADQCSDIRSKVFRLHIIANSDSDADQALKLKVRDKILEFSPELFSGASDKDEVMAQAQQNLDEIQAIAQQEVCDEGYSYGAQVEIVNMYFTTRTYGDVTLPAGNYDALRIIIGAGEGHNWWCVLFPPLCLPSAESKETLQDALGNGEASVVTGDSEDIVIKFKIVELYEEALNYIQNAFSSQAAA